MVAQKAITGIERDKPVIVVGGFAHLSAKAMGVAPAVVRAGSRLSQIRFRAGASLASDRSRAALTTARASGCSLPR